MSSGSDPRDRPARATAPRRPDGKATLSVGRSSTSDIVLDEPTVSRRHAALTPTEAGSYRFVDQGSTSGSYRMEGGAWRPMTDREVRHGERLRLGDFETTLGDLLGRAAPPGARPDGTAAERAGVANKVEREPPAGPSLDGAAHPPTGAIPSETPKGAGVVASDGPPARPLVERDPATGRIVVRSR